jgi:hypothetical protein
MRSDVAEARAFVETPVAGRSLATSCSPGREAREAHPAG